MTTIIMTSDVRHTTTTRVTAPLTSDVRDTTTTLTVAPLTSDVSHTTATLAAAPTPSTVTTHPPTGSWVYTVIPVIGVVIVVTTVTVIVLATAVPLLLRRRSQTKNDPNHAWLPRLTNKIPSTIIWILSCNFYRKIFFCRSTDNFVSKHDLLSCSFYNIPCLSVSSSPRNNSEVAKHINNRKETCQLKEISGLDCTISIAWILSIFDKPCNFWYT